MTIDHNVSQRALRPQSNGRKNWDFTGSAGAARPAAVLFAILAGAKRHHLEPRAYLRDGMQRRLSVGEKDLETSLPDRCAASYPEGVPPHRLDE